MTEQKPAQSTPQQAQADPIAKKNWKNNKSTSTNRNQAGKQGAFKGAISALNGHVYEVHNEAFKANQYQKTTKAISAYVNRTMKNGNDMRYIIENLAEVDFNALLPTEPKTDNPKVNEMMLQQAVNLFMKHKELYEVNKNALYTIIWEQCSKVLQAKLEGTDEYKDYAPISCPIGLLKHIKQVSLRFENVTYTAAAVDDAKVALYSFYQTKQDSLHQYYLKFKDLCDALEHYGADVGYDISLVRDAASRHGEKDTDQIDHAHPSYALYKNEARDRYLALRFIRGADRAKFGDLIVELENDYSKGSDYFPSTVASAYTLLKRYKKNTQSKQTNKLHAHGDALKGRLTDAGDDIHAMVFVNKDGKPIGKDMACFGCGSNHYKGDPKCPKQSKITEDNDYPGVEFVSSLEHSSLVASAEPRNSVHLPRTLNAISLHPIGNVQGGYYFLCLSTWRVLARRSWTALPMPAFVIDLLTQRHHDERAQRAQYLPLDNFHFRHSDRSTITYLDTDDSHLLLYPFVTEGAPSTCARPAGAPDNDAETPNENADTSHAGAHADKEYHFNTDDTHSDADDIDTSAVMDNDDDLMDDDDNDRDNIADDDPGSINGDSANESIEDDMSDDSESVSDPVHEDGFDDEFVNEDGSNTKNEDNSEAHASPNATEPPLDSLESIIRATAPLQRDPNAKNSIDPEITASNIVSSSPDARPSTQRYTMRPPVTPMYAKDGFNLAIACTQMTAKEGLKCFGQLAAKMPCSLSGSSLIISRCTMECTTNSYPLSNAQGCYG